MVITDSSVVDHEPISTAPVFRVLLMIYHGEGNIYYNSEAYALDIF